MLATTVISPDLGEEGTQACGKFTGVCLSVEQRHSDQGSWALKLCNFGETYL